MGFKIRLARTVTLSCMHPDQRRLAHMVDHAQLALRLVESTEDRRIDSERVAALGFQRAVEIVGEAAAAVGEKSAGKVHIDWSGLIGLRNVIVHQYDRLDQVRLKDIVRAEFPRLLAQLRFARVG